MEKITKARELYYRVLGLQKEGKPEEADRIVDQIAGMDASTSGEYLLRGYARRMSGNKDEGLDDYVKAIELDPNNTEAIMRIGYIQLTSGEPEQALATFEEVIGKEPESQQAYKAKGTAMHSLKRFDELLTYYQNLIDLFPGSADFWRFEYSSALFAKGKNREALEILEALADHRPLTSSFASPPSYLYYLHKAVVLTALSRFDDALDILKTGYEITEREDGCLPCFASNCWRVHHFEPLRQPPYLEKLEAIIGPKPKIHQKT